MNERNRKLFTHVIIIFAFFTYFNLPSTAVVEAHYTQWDYHEQARPFVKKIIPAEIMVDSTNDLAYRIMYYHSISNRNNFAFSPTALISVIIALFEGSSSRSFLELRNCLDLPTNRDVVRVGLRDIHRRLRVYFFNQDNPLNGLSLNKENVTITPEYEAVLKFYGYDLGMDMVSSTPDSLMPELTTEPIITTTEAIGLTTIVDRISDDETTTEIITTTEVPTTTTKVKTTTESKTEPTTETTRNTMPPTTTPITLISTFFPITLPTTVTPRTTPTITTEAFTELTTTELPKTTMYLRAFRPIPNAAPGQASAIPLEIPPRVGPLLESLKINPNTRKGSSMLNMENTPMFPNTRRVNRPISIIASMKNGMVMKANATLRNKRHFYSGFKTVFGPPISASGYSHSLYNNALRSSFVSPSLSVPAHPRHVEEDVYIAFVPAEGSPINSLQTPIIDHLNNPGLGFALDPGYIVPKETSLNNIINHIFYLNPQETIQATYKTYNSILNYKYLEPQKISVLELELDSSEYNLMIFLPDFNVDMDSAAASLKHVPTLRILRQQLKPRWVQAIIPDFKLKGNIYLTNDLQNMGVRDIFEPSRADFSPMSDEKDIYVKHIEQPINVHIRTRPIDQVKRNLAQQYHPIEVAVNHPFLFFIVDKELNVAIMAGRILNPLNVRIQ